MANRSSQILLLIIAFVIGGWVALKYLGPQNKPVEESSVLLEQIKTVAKLTTVEGQFSEIYNYSEYQGSFGMFWDKKALVRVRATVAAGYDLNNLNISVDPEHKTIHMTPLGEPQILSIDHTIDYYDISEGFFTSFAPEDYNKINARAKDLIREQALKSTLLPASREQGQKIMDIINSMVKNAGWTLDTGGKSAILPQ